MKTSEYIKGVAIQNALPTGPLILLSIPGTILIREYVPLVAYHDRFFPLICSRMGADVAPRLGTRLEPRTK